MTPFDSCPSCGAGVPPPHRFCGTCGFDMNGVRLSPRPDEAGDVASAVEPQAPPPRSRKAAGVLVAGLIVALTAIAAAAYATLGGAGLLRIVTFTDEASSSARTPPARGRLVATDAPFGPAPAAQPPLAAVPLASAQVAVTTPAPSPPSRPVQRPTDRPGDATPLARATGRTAPPADRQAADEPRANARGTPIGVVEDREVPAIGASGATATVPPPAGAVAPDVLRAPASSGAAAASTAAGPGGSAVLDVPPAPRTGPAPAGTGSASPDAARAAACGRVLGPGIASTWTALGGATGPLGCPIEDEGDAPRSPRATTGRMARFEGGGGALIVSHTSGPLAGRSFAVQGCVLRLYMQMGGAGSWLGYPVSDHYVVPAGARTDFEVGFVTWDARTDTCRAEASPASR